LIKNLFIIGAGFTKAVFPAAPLNDEFLGQVVGLSQMILHSERFGQNMGRAKQKFR
jgi:hypothetical protein